MSCRTAVRVAQILALPEGAEIPLTPEEQARVDAARAREWLWRGPMTTTGGEPAASTLTIERVRRLRVVLLEAHPDALELDARDDLQKAAGRNDAQLEPDAVEELLALARAGDAATFKALAGMVGVPVNDLDALWTGTVRRLGR